MTVSLDRNQSGVADEVLSVLRCLSCRGHLEDRESELMCAGCNRKYPLVNGIVRFVDAQQYAGSFGFQWQLHARTQLDNNESQRSERAFRRRTGFRPEDRGEVGARRGMRHGAFCGRGHTLGSPRGRH